jgi:hypothetical protein
VGVIAGMHDQSTPRRWLATNAAATVLSIAKRRNHDQYTPMSGGVARSSKYRASHADEVQRVQDLGAAFKTCP